MNDTDTRPRWRIYWHDGTGDNGPITRDSVAALLHTVRSRRPLTGERIKRTAEGYRFGTVEVRRPAA